MKNIFILLSVFTYLSICAQNITVHPSGISINENYVYSRTYLDSTTTSATSTKQVQSVSYFDGLGRPKQSVAIKASPTGKDLVTTIPYDGFGRQVDSWLYAPMTSLNGGIQTGVEGATTGFYGDTNPYSQKVLENSPLDRIQKQIQVGQDWSAKPVTFDYLAVQATDLVKKYTFTTGWGSDGATTFTIPTSTIYADNTLYKNSVKDEDGSETIEFKNGRGQTILVRKVLSSTENADTYYVYNDYDQLTYVISPLASVKITLSQTDLDNLCYQYRYDGKNRLVEKKLPGKGSEFMVYDQQDRLVLTQDANLRLINNNFKATGWIFTKYDKFGRVAYTGFFPNGAKRVSMQNALSNMRQNAPNNEERTTSPTVVLQNMPLYYNNEAFPTGSKTLLTINYYDTYPVGTPIPSDNKIQNVPILQEVASTGVSQTTKSLPTASFVKNIEDDNWTENYSFYDRKGRVIGSHSINHLSGYTKTESILDFTGVPQKMFTYHKRLNSSTEVKIEETFEYDHQNRLLVHKHQVDLEPEEILTQNTYNEIGQLKNKKVGGTTINSSLQSIDYAYNIRGWMTHINDPSNLGIKLFGYKIKYNNVDGLQVPNTDFTNDKVLPKYNGNIAEVDWSTANDGVLRRYGYVYDGLNRLTAGYYQNSQNPSAKEYFEHLLYDSNGNITKLKRSSSVLAGNSFATLIDNLTYSSTGNQLQSISDAQQNSDGYPYTAIPKSITYDPNGRMTSMPDKGISEIDYNYLNLPVAISSSQGNTNYIYGADGVKIKKTYGTKVTAYLNGFQYENDLLQFIPTLEGYYDFIKNAYIYNYTDHLGNVRLSYYKNSAGVLTIDTESNYYPFGLKHEGYNENQSTATFNYKYNGKELQETGMYDYGARMYMPDIGRWGVVDPLAEMYRRYSPYNYTVNNPINFTDPDGRWVKGAGFWNNITKSDSRIHAEQWAEKLGSGNYNVSVNKGSNGSWTVSSHSLIASTKETFDSKGLKNTLYVPYSEGGGLGTAPSYGDPWGTTIGSIPESRGKTQMQTMVAENPLVQDAIIGAVTAGVINKGVLQASEGLSRVLNVNKQARHLLGTAKEGGGFVNSMDDAHAVLNAVHLGEATYLGTSKAGYQVYRFGGVTGTNVNIGAGITAQPTNVFMIKGTINPSIVPTTPLWTP